MIRRLWVFLVIGVWVGCSGPEVEGDTDVDVAEEGLTYYGEIAPIINTHCAGCHYPGEGAPLDLHTFEDVRNYAQISLGYMESGDMPPWMPDPSCRDYQRQRIMPAEEIALFREWVETGMAEGTPADDFEGFSPPPRPDPDVTARVPGAPYHPREDLSDEYRCFLMDVEFEEETFVTGTHVDTGGVEVIHHANLFLVPPFDLATVEALEAQNDEPGYPCYGSPGFNSIHVIGTWVPGMEPIFVPEGSAVTVPAGSRLVMQTHFNTVFAEPEPVNPEVHLFTQPEPPENRVRAMTFANMNIVIPPGDSNSMHIEEFTNRSDDSWQVLGVVPHLHALAKRVLVDVRRPGEDENVCLVDIPNWDFNWQQDYRFLDDEWVEVHPGDTLRLVCIYDNSPENQPVIDGVQQEPQEVRWGARSVDEMCMAFLIVSEPYTPPIEGDLCEQFDGCRAACSDPYGVGCIFNCGAQEIDCGVCLLSGAQSCSNRYCPQELNAAIPCLYNCAQASQAGGDMDACLSDECPDERDDLEECLRPRIETGLCNQDIAECNIEF